MPSLSLIVLCRPAADGTGAAESIVRTLSAFVAASVKGVVRDVVLAGPPKHELGFIADQAGCAFVEAENEAGALRQALALSRADHLMILYAGYVPDIGFVEAIEDLLASSTGKSRGWLLRTAPENFVERLFPFFAPAVGLVLQRRVYADTAVPTLANLIKAAQARAVSRLRLRRVA